MRKIFIILFYFVLQQSGYSQEEIIDPPSRLLTRVQFNQLIGGVVMFKALLNNLPDTLNFILDSGSSGISLDSATVAYFHLVPSKSDKAIKGIAGIRNVDFLYNQSLKINNLQIDSLDFHINNYEVLTSVYGEKVDGIVGYSVFKRFIIKVNNDSLTIDFNSLGSIKYPKGGYLLKPTITSLPSNNAFIKDNNKKFYNSRFLFDIGAGLCALFSKDYVEDNALLKKRKWFAKTGQGVGGKILMNITVLKELRIGNYRFKQVPVYIFDDVNNVVSYPFQGGLIGNDIYRRFNIVFNYKKKEFHLIPNSHFGDPFDYAYSGIELYLIDGNIVIGELIPGSPGDLAGLKEGDIIIGVGNFFTGNLNQYKIALQKTRENIKITYKRNDVFMQTTVKVKSIK